MEDTPEARAKYQEYLAWRKRQKAKKQSLANIAADEKSYRASSGGEGQNFEIATGAGRINTGIKKSGGLDRTLAGIGSGLASVSDRVGNLLGAEGRFSDEAIASKNEIEKDLLSTGGGAGGRLVGQIAATAPIGVLGRAAGALPGASRALSMAARVPGAARVGRATGAALEGAGAGLLMSNPGEGAGGAATGALFGGGMNAAGQVGGKLARAMRPKITDSARRVMDRTGEHVPITQALPEDSIVRALYGNVVANIPGQRLRGQNRRVVDAVREELFEDALPHRVPVNSVFQKGDDVYEAMKHATAEWDRAFDDTNKAVVNGFDVPRKIVNAIRRRKPRAVIPEAGKPITGRHMADFKQYVEELRSDYLKSSFTRHRAAELQQVSKTVDKRMYRDLLRQNARNVDGDPLWTTYAQNSKRYANWLKVKQAAKGEAGAEFTPKQWEKIVRKSNLREPTKDFADDAAKALPKFPSNFGTFQMAAAMGLVGGGLGALSAGKDASWGERALGGAAGVAAMGGGANVLSTKAVQRMVAQYGKKGLLDRYPALLREYARNAVISDQVNEDQ